MLSGMFLAGAQNLDDQKDWINELNVFPVPDGDTGTNMTMTALSAVREIENLGDAPEMNSLLKAISSGSLRGARGNSGVILSQLCRGFTKSLKNQEMIDVPLLAAACEKAVETAYKAVIKPKEGTILTVARSIADRAAELADSDLTVEEFFEEIIQSGNEALAKTPEMLPVLKEAGVVDSGGQGLMAVLEGAYGALTGKAKTSAKKDQETVKKEPSPLYLIEFLLRTDKKMLSEQKKVLKAELDQIGDTVVLLDEKEGLIIHLYSDRPGIVLERVRTLGRLSRVSILNRSIEKKEELLIPNAEELAKAQREQLKPLKEVGFIPVCIGDGFFEIFKGLNADFTISGGQTMNPSTEDVLNAIDQVHAKNIFLFPNNKNVIMAAKQARELVREKNVIVIPTTAVTQGITAMINYDPVRSVEENQEMMLEEIENVRTAEVTYAVRDTTIDGRAVHQNDIMAVGDKGLLALGKDISATAEEALTRMVDDETSLISIYYGKDFPEEKAEQLGDRLQELYPEVDVEVNFGGQPVYYCILSVE